MRTTTPMMPGPSRMHSVSALPPAVNAAREFPAALAADMGERCLTVSYCCPDGRAYVPLPKPMPYLRLLGRWLERAGFAIGAKVRERVTPRRLILELIEDNHAESPEESLRRTEAALS
jgi:hypothetical protein